jgi:hypothetical protein
VFLVLLIRLLYWVSGVDKCVWRYIGLRVEWVSISMERWVDGYVKWNVDMDITEWFLERK